jgi:hypothetical protein
VQKRLLSSLGGGFLGVLVASPANNSLGLSPTADFIVCASIGLALGYVGSILYDVFTASSRGKKA